MRKAAASVPEQTGEVPQESGSGPSANSRVQGHVLDEAASDLKAFRLRTRAAACKICGVMVPANHGRGGPGAHRVPRVRRQRSPQVQAM